MDDVPGGGRGAAEAGGGLGRGSFGVGFAGGEPEVDEAGEAGDDRGCEDADLGLVHERLLVEGEAGDEERDGEADAGEDACAEDVDEADVVRERGEAEADGQPGEDEDAERLADDEAERDTGRDGTVDGVGDETGRELDAGVCEGEERDDEETGPGVERLLEAFERGLRVAGEAFELADGVGGGLGVAVVAGTAVAKEEVEGVLLEALLVEVRAGTG